MGGVTVGGSLFLIAVGAILRFAVKDSIEDVELATVGVILMVVGVVGLLAGLWLARRARTPVADEPVARDRYDRRDY